MGIVRLFAILLAMLIVESGWCHHHHRGVHVDDRPKGEVVDQEKRYSVENVVSSGSEKSRKNLNIGEVKGSIPFSEKRLEKMLEKAILKIITGDLSTGDMLLLKSLNYTLDEILAIRERELGKQKNEEPKKKENSKPWTKINKYKEKTSSKRSEFDELKHQGKRNRHADKSLYKDFDFEAYNRQAIMDYENLPSNVEFQQSWSEATDYEETTKVSRQDENNLHRDFDKAMESHVVFKIRYDDSEFDSSSGSDENKNRKKHRVTSVRHAPQKNISDSFHESTLSTAPPSVDITSGMPIVYQLNNLKAKHPSTSSISSTTIRNEPAQVLENHSNDSKIEENKRVSEYEGLEWVEDDVYRVIPEFMDSLDMENAEANETSDYEDSTRDSHWSDNENDTVEYQNDATDSFKLFMANGNSTITDLPIANRSTYVQVAIAHRRERNLTSSFDSQGEKAIEDIKSKVLALTGRFNQSSNANQVQRERLTMFSPTCQIPRNTDQEAWTDPFSMNMHFQLNLTSSDHVVAAKLRLFKLPQENITASTESTFEEEEEDEKKIRISVYYYTKSLKRHRSKKRLMDSIVTPLTSKGTHLALDVRQGLRFWRLNTRNSHGNGSNHGLVVQVEDQDGRPLKPALYIQQPSCADQDSDQKTSEYLHSSFEPVLVTFAS